MCTLKGRLELLVVIALLGLGAPAVLAAQCNPCHYCPWDDNRRIVTADGFSTIKIAIPEMITCGEEYQWCEDLGEPCRGESPLNAELLALARKIDADEEVDVKAFAAKFPEHVIVLPERGLALVKSECSDELIAVLPWIDAGGRSGPSSSPR
jgi:hypothetical protein